MELAEALVRRDAVVHPCPQGLHIDLAARDDERHSNLAARRVGAGHDRGIGDRGMLDERR